MVQLELSAHSSLCAVYVVGDGVGTMAVETHMKHVLPSYHELGFREDKYTNQNNDVYDNQ